jgi:hypothetical protein
MVPAGQPDGRACGRLAATAIWTTQGAARQVGRFVELSAYVGARHEETGRLVAAFLGLSPDDPVRNSKGVVTTHLSNLIGVEGRPGGAGGGEGEEP